MADTFKRYPKGVISHKVGDLQQCTNFKLSVKNGAKLKHTLRRSPSGWVLGTVEGTLSFDMEIDEDGPERNFHRALISGEAQGFRLKFPGETFKITGVVSSRDIDAPLDDAVKVSVEVLCKVEQV